MTSPADFPSEDIEIELLHLDPLNPRLPEEVQGKSEAELQEFIADAYDAIEVARSIADHGYFPSEPIIVVKHPELEGHYLVAEGNRRLVALRLLADPDSAEDLDDADEWLKLSKSTSVPKKVPAIIAPDHTAVAPIIGYRHISGIQPWEPFAKARFIDRLVGEGSSFEETADVVGQRPWEVAAQYRNLKIVEQAREWGVDTTRATRAFGVFTRAMTGPLREYIDAPAPSNVSTDAQPVPEGNKEELKELLSWLFGDDLNTPVIGESRQISELGAVVNSGDGLKILKQTRDLEAAFVAAGGLRDRLARRLQNAHNNLVAAQEDFSEYSDDAEIQSLVENCRDALDSLAGAGDET